MQDVCHYMYSPAGVCINGLSFDIIDGVIRNYTAEGGCEGNRRALAALVDGQEPENVIRLLSGCDCHGRGNSCPNQLALALTQCLHEFQDKE